MDNTIMLERRTEQCIGDDCSFGNLFDALTEYGLPELKNYIVRHYSKLDAIDRHTYDLTPDMARALLTDRGLLFAQTRERSYPAMHSRRLLDSTRYGKEPVEIGLRLGKENIGDFVKLVLNDCTPVLAEGTSMEEPTAKIKKLDKMLRVVLDKCRDLNFIASKLYHPGEDPGYVKCASDEEQKAWVATVMLLFSKRQKSVAAAKWLRKHVEDQISDKEMFLFLAYVLPAAVSEASRRDNTHRFYKAARRKPEPLITLQQREELNEQIKAYHQRDSYRDFLVPWEGAGKMLRSYFLPMQKKCRIIRKNNTPTLELDSCYNAFLTSFEKYFRTIKIKPHRSEEEMSQEMTDFIFQITSDGNKPLLIDQPLTIYRIVRSPFHRNVSKESEHHWIYLMIENSNSDVSFPILKKFMDAETNLYSGIVDACAIGCEHFQIDFDEDSWRNLWDCIEQSVDCLSYDYDDLLSVPVLFKSGYHEFHRFFPVLDQWLRDKISDTDNPFEPALWRGIYNNFDRIQTRKGSTLTEIDLKKDILAPYRRIFTSTKPDIDRLLEILNVLAKCFKWNYVTCLPTVDELIQAEKKLSFEHEKISKKQIASYVKIIRLAISKEDENVDKYDRNAVKEIQLVMTEWVLLQQICYQTQINLFRAIDRAINGDRQSDTP